MINNESSSNASLSIISLRFVSFQSMLQHNIYLYRIHCTRFNKKKNNAHNLGIKKMGLSAASGNSIQTTISLLVHEWGE